ncbi:DUF4064 domain-containing protein [Amycolatopsis rhabdoformis]|uniref:DUF4064 domain-containing protein n=1 Tax=Amycolatopsis rhabdoformis TaxID=1448059 RepID=A0ABZ1I3W5_9PSEU|nr:DUF4064 domain-containing protein [Amycolatopsis rhabdoformis]WSE28955.1 DUF4064 domain-containing protein [Amycolatopsis rhabdoformis]
MAEKDDNTAEPTGLTSDDLAKQNPGQEDTSQGTATPENAAPENTAPETAAQEAANAAADKSPAPGTAATGTAAQTPEANENPAPETAAPTAADETPAAARETAAPGGVTASPSQFTPPSSQGLPAGLPPMPAYLDNDDEPQREGAPGPVRAAFILTIIASLVLLIGQVVTILFKQQLVDQAVKATPPGRKLDMAQLESNANTLVWALFVGALCFGVIMVLFAYKAREGTRSARSVVTLLAVLGLVFQLGLVRSIFSVVSSLLLVILVVLLYLPSTRDFFPKVGKSL